MQKTNFKSNEPRPAFWMRNLDGVKSFTAHHNAQRWGERAPDETTILAVECGLNKATMDLSKLRQGSKGPCIEYQGSRLTPNEFQFVSGRETAKDWKRSIRHNGKSLKHLVAQNIIEIHQKTRDCQECQVTNNGNKDRLTNRQQKSPCSPDVTHREPMRGIANNVFAKGGKQYVHGEAARDLSTHPMRVIGEKGTARIKESDKNDEGTVIIVDGGDKESKYSENNNGNTIKHSNIYEKSRSGISEHAFDMTIEHASDMTSEHASDMTPSGGESNEEDNRRVSIVKYLANNPAVHQVDKDMNNYDSDDYDEDTVKYDYDPGTKAILEENEKDEKGVNSNSDIGDVAADSSIDTGTVTNINHNGGYMSRRYQQPDTDDECTNDMNDDGPLDLSVSSSSRTARAETTDNSRLKSKLIREKRSKRCRIIDQYMTTCIARHLQSALDTSSDRGDMKQAHDPGVLMDKARRTISRNEGDTHIEAMGTDLTLGALDPDSCSYDSGIDDTNVFDGNIGDVSVGITSSPEKHVREMKENDIDSTRVILKKAELDDTSSHEIGEGLCRPAHTSSCYESEFSKHDPKRTIYSKSESSAFCNCKDEIAILEHKGAFHAERRKQCYCEDRQSHHNECHLSRHSLPYHQHHQNNQPYNEVVNRPKLQNSQQRKLQRKTQRDHYDHHHINSLQQTGQTEKETRATLKSQNTDRSLGKRRRYDVKDIQHSKPPFWDGLSKMIPTGIQQQLSFHAGLAQSSEYIRMLTSDNTPRLSPRSSSANLKAADFLSSYASTGVAEFAHQPDAKPFYTSHPARKEVRTHLPAVHLELPELPIPPFIRRSLFPSWPPLRGSVNPAVSSAYEASSSKTRHANSVKLMADRTCSSPNKYRHHSNPRTRKRKTNSDPAELPLDLSTKKLACTSSVDSAVLLTSEALLSSSSASRLSENISITRGPPPSSVNNQINTHRRNGQETTLTEYVASPSQLPSKTAKVLQSKRDIGCNCEGIYPLTKWTVDDVCTFLCALDGCAEYVKVFRYDMMQPKAISSRENNNRLRYLTRSRFYETGRFRDNEVDGRVLTALSYGRLTEDLGMKHRPAILLRRALVKLEQAKRHRCQLCRDKDGCNKFGVISFRDIKSNNVAVFVG